MYGKFKPLMNYNILQIKYLTRHSGNRLHEQNFIADKEKIIFTVSEPNELFVMTCPKKMWAEAGQRQSTQKQ